MSKVRIPRVPDDIFISEFQTLGTTAMARKYSLTTRNIQLRRRTIERNYGIVMQTPNLNPGGAANAGIYEQERFPGRLNLSIVRGVVIIGGDAHYWPGKPPVMHRALLYFLDHFRKEKSLRSFIMNGDVMDFPTISRWPQVDWEKRPSVKDEIENAVIRMHELEKACGNLQKFWPLGNHDARFSMHIASKAPELAGVHGVHLKDHFPDWQPCWSVEINDGFNATVVKHTFKGGIHAPKNNVDAAGCHFITNHLHCAQVRPVTKRHHTFYGVDTGCLADIYGSQFLYCQDNPRDWRPAFAVATYNNSKLLLPELVLGIDQNHVEFRGEIIKV